MSLITEQVERLRELAKQDKLGLIPWNGYSEILNQAADTIEQLAAKARLKTGYWIMKHRTHNEIKHYTGQDEMGETHTISVLERYEADEPYCSECGKRAGDTSQNYCCACGAKMIEPQEREGTDADNQT